MRNFFKAGIILSLIVFGAQFVSAASINLSIPHYPPYNYLDNGEVKGISVDIVKKVFKSMGMEYKITEVPNFKRAMIDLEKGISDGFFIGSKNDERDQIAVLSEVLLDVKRVWVLPKDSRFDPNSEDFRKKAKIGSQFKSSLYNWLEENKYKNGAMTTDPKALVKMMFKAKRLDALYIIDQNFYFAAKELGLKKGDYKVVVQKSIPTGMYISKKYLKNNPGFMKKLNKAIKANR